MIRVAQNNSNVVFGGGILLHELRVILFEHRGRDIRAAVMPDDGCGVAEVSLANEQDAFAGLEGNSSLLVMLPAMLLLHLLLLLPLLLLALLRIRGLVVLALASFGM